MITWEEKRKLERTYPVYLSLNKSQLFLALSTFNRGVNKIEEISETLKNAEKISAEFLKTKITV